MVTITKNICRKLGSELYIKNTLYRNTVNKIENNCILNYNDVSTNIPTGYRGIYKYGLHTINSKVNLIYKSARYTVEEAKERKRLSTNKSRVKNYAEKHKQYKKDIDKSLSQISNKKLSWILANFFAKHYQFNYFVTLTFNQIRLKNKEKIYSKEEYEYALTQDYINTQKDYSLSQVQDNVTTYLNRLKHKQKSIVDYYVVTYQQTIKGHWHAHIAMQVTNTSKQYWSTFLTSRWNLGQAKTKKIRVDTPTKENTANVVNYLTKDVNHKDLDIINWDTNITKNSKRIFTDLDLNTLEKIEYWLDTDNALTVNKLLPHLPISNIKLTA